MEGVTKGAHLRNLQKKICPKFGEKNSDIFEIGGEKNSIVIGKRNEGHLNAIFFFFFNFWKEKKILIRIFSRFKQNSITVDLRKENHLDPTCDTYLYI